MPKTNLLIDTDDKRYCCCSCLHLRDYLEVSITFTLCVDFTKVSAIIFNQSLNVLGTGLTIPAKVFRHIFCCSLLFFCFFVAGFQ